MTSLDSLAPGVVERINEFVCRIDVQESGVEVDGVERICVRMVNWWCFEDSLIKLMLVSRRFVASMTPPPRPAHVRNDQRTWWRAPTPATPEIEEID